MAELFISYRSSDRSWAERLYFDLQRRFPMLSLFLDQEPLKLTEPYRPVLQRELRAADHLALLWSDATQVSTEVVSEVTAFQAAAAQDPTNGGRVQERSVFYIPLQGIYSPLEGNQGLPAMKTLGVYDPVATDRGVSKLEERRSPAPEIGSSAASARESTTR